MRAVPGVLLRKWMRLSKAPPDTDRVPLTVASPSKLRRLTPDVGAETVTLLKIADWARPKALRVVVEV